MKKFLLLTVALATIVLAGCDKGKDGEGGSGKLAGKWELVAEYELVDGEWMLDYTYESGETAWEFLSDGTLKVYEEGELAGSMAYSYNESTREMSCLWGVFYAEKLTATELVLIDKEDDDWKTVLKRAK